MTFFRILVLTLFLSVPSWATIAISTYTACSGGNCVTPGATTTGATLLILARSCGGTCVSAPVDSKSNGWTALTSQTVNSDVEQIFYSTNPIVGTGHTFTGNGTGGCVMAFSGVDTSANPFDLQSGATVNPATTIKPGAITPSVNNAVVVSYVGVARINAQPTVDAGMTITNSYAFSSGVVFQQACAYAIQTTAAAIDPTWTLGGSSAAGATIASFKSSNASVPAGITINFKTNGLSP